jgi:hypothetical protein
MNLSEIARVLQRRWMVVASVLLLTVLAVFLTAIRANSDFQATAILLLASPELGGSDQQTSESSDDGSMALSPSIIAEIVRGDNTRVALGPESNVTDYAVTVTADNILQVEATNDTADGVVQTADAVIDEIQRVVEDLKAENSEPAATLDILSRPRVPRERTLVGPTGETSVEYYASGSVLLTIEANETELFNPYTPSGGTLRVLVEVASTERVRESIMDVIDDDEATFELIFDSRDVAAVLHVVATANSADGAMDTLDAAVGFLDDDLEERQMLAGADESTFLWYQRLAYPDEAEVASGGLQRPIATIIVLGVVAAVSLAILVDSVIGSRRKMRSAVGPDASDDDGELTQTESPQRTLKPAKSREAS